MVLHPPDELRIFQAREQPAWRSKYQFEHRLLTLSPLNMMVIVFGNQLLITTECQVRFPEFVKPQEG
jgi:hypothetical protein